MQKRGVTFAVVALLHQTSLGCRSRGEELADLVELHGAANRDFAAKPEEWGKANVGEKFHPGDAIRTEADSDAHVRLRRGGALKLGSKSLVRFRNAGAGSQRLVGIESGEAELESGDEGLEFETRLGRAHIEGGGRLKIFASRERTQFEVLIGQTVLEEDGGPGMRLDRGDRISFDIGGAILEHVTSPAPEASGSSPETAAPEGAGANDVVLGMTVTASVEGSGAQIRRNGKPWAPLPSGEVDAPEGARLRLPKGTTLSVARGGERATVHGAAEVTVGKPGAPLLDTVDGDVDLDGSDALVEIQVPGGSILVRRQARASVSVRRGKPTEVKDQTGEVEVRGKNGKKVLSTGETAALPRTGELEEEDVTTPRVDFSIVAGESPVVHDPSAPTGVRILFPSMCSGEGEVEWSGSARKKGGRSRGAGSATVLAGPGANKYRVRCIDENGPGDVRSQGAITVARDSGTAHVPRKAPHNLIDADGRRYTVLYQNLLPNLTVGWPSAPAGTAFKLHLEPERGDPRTIDARTANVKFTSGQLGEGTYGFWFEVPGDAAHRSPKTTLRIDFDNAAPAAHIQEPAAGASISGTVTVAGVAVEGARVSVSGVDIPLDGQYRFRDQASAKAGELSLAIRIAHPKHGVNYYLRRLKVEP